MFKVYGPYVDGTNIGDSISYKDDEGNTHTYYYIGTMTTDENGVATQKGLKISKEGSTFVYVLNESTAPAGYAPDTNIKVITVEVGGDYDQNGVHEIDFPNTKKENAKVSVTVKKKWDVTHTNPPASVSVELYQVTGRSKVAKCVKTIQLDDTGTWTNTVSDLPAFNSEDTGIQYDYYVREVPVAGYEAFYSNENGVLSPETLQLENGTTVEAFRASAGIETHTVTVTNTATFTLPESGGWGTWLYRLGGLLLAAVAVIMAKRKM